VFADVKKFDQQKILNSRTLISLEIYINHQKWLLLATRPYPQMENKTNLLKIL
jgi:hypothetical protein